MLLVELSLENRCIETTNLNLFLAIGLNSLSSLSVLAEQLHDLRILDGVKELDGLGVVRHTGNGPVQAR